MAVKNFKHTVNDNMKNDSSPSAATIDMAILLTLNKNCVEGNTVSCIKPNKLRKIVCSTKSKDNITWTQFASSLERLVAEEKVDIIVNDQGEDTVRLNKKMIPRLSNNDAVSNATQRNIIVEEEEKQALKRANKCNPKHELNESNFFPPSRQNLIRTVRIPPEVLMHLTKNNKAKLHRIEQNTKTTISVQDKEKGSNMITLTIESVGVPASSDAEGKAKGEEDSWIIKQRKRVNFAVKLLEIMIQSFEEHPEHFQRQKRLEDDVEQLQQKQKTMMDREKKKQRKFY